MINRFLCGIAASTVSLLTPQITSAQSFTPGQILTLEQAYDRAAATDQSIRVAYQESRKANLLPWSALTRLGPQVNGNLGFQHNYNQTSSLTLDPSGPVTSRTNTGSAGLSLSQPLFDLTAFPAYRVGKLAAESALLQYRFTVRQTLFGVAQAYYEVLKQQAVARVNQQTFELANRQLQLSQERLDLGDVARSDVLRARATLEGARQTLISTASTLEVDRNNLSNILNLGGDTSFHLAEPPDASDEIPSLEAAMDEARRNREDYQANALAVEEDVQRRKEVLAEYAPRIVAQAGANLAGESSARNGPENKSDSEAWDAGVAVQIPFLTGGQREIDLSTAGRQIVETRLNHETAGKNLQEEVKNAWLQARSLKATIKAARAQLAATEQTYTDVENEYKEGSATSLDAQSALIDLNNARTTVTTEVYAYQVALLDLQRAMARFQQRRVAMAGNLK